ESSTNKDNNGNLSRTPSNLSSSMTTEDWDKSFSSTPHTNGDLPLPSGDAAASNKDGSGTQQQGGVGGERNRRSLSDLMRMYGEQGKNMQLSAEEEKVLSEELGMWINSDSSPYEGDD
ncbi:hypothetical protein SCHPADRAFT_791668, partial [Schizopora paradoxa]